jgi:plasmid maintenance system antidote protein VapI
MIDTNEIKRKNLKRLLDEHNIKPADLARKIGTTNQYVNSLLNAEKGLSDKSIAKLAKAFGVEEYEFYIGITPDHKIENLTNGKIISFPVLKPEITTADTEQSMMHKFLDDILNFGDEDLILAIKLNLVSFKKTVDALKKIDNQGSLLKDALDRIKRLEQRGG